MRAKKILLVLFPFWAVFGALALAVQAKNQFTFAHPVPWCALADKLLLDSLVYLIILSLLERFSRFKLLQAVFVVSYLFSYLLDAAVYWDGNTRFEHYHLDLIRSESLLAFFNSTADAAVLFWMLCSIGAIAAIRRAKAELFALPVVALCVVAASIWALNVPRRLSEHRINALGAEAKKMELPVFLETNIWSQVSYLRSNDFFRFLRELTKRNAPSGRTIPSAELKDWQDVITKYHLSLGKHDYPPLTIKPFKKIILVTSESFSLDLLAPYNSKLPEGISPFLGSPAIRRSMFVHYLTSGTPTLQGLSAMFHSNANFELVRSAEEQPATLVSLLGKAGYETVHLRGSSKFYGSENILFRKWGFRRFISLESLREKYGERYTKGWGLMDRFLFDALVQTLKEDPGKKIFLHVPTIDTHPLTGRMDYAGVEYPEPPSDIKPLLESHKILDAVFHHDFDLGGLVERLKSEGLWKDDLLLILTADHCSPYNAEVQAVPGYPADSLCRIPLIFLTAQELPAVPTDRLASQLDLAPTVLHLLGIQIPAGYWGASLFAENPAPSAVGEFQGSVTVTLPDGPRLIAPGHPSNESDRRFLELYKTLVRN